jgi:hypothetical protein
MVPPLGLCCLGTPLALPRVGFLVARPVEGAGLHPALGCAAVSISPTGLHGVLTGCGELGLASTYPSGLGSCQRGLVRLRDHGAPSPGF